MAERSCVRVGLVQMASAGEESANLTKALAAVDRLAGDGAEIIALPELFLTDYFCQTEDPAYFKKAEPVPGPTTGVMAKKAAERGVVLIVPVFERRGEGIYHNSAVVIDSDGTLTGVYRKMHIPQDPGFSEKYYFTPGDLGFPCFETRRGRMGVLICWDQWFPEAARLAALNGVQILFYPTAIGWRCDETDETVRAIERDAWETVQRSHAIANGIYVAAVNRVGREKGLEFWGRSFLAGPRGDVLVRAEGSGEKLLVADCDLSCIETQRQAWPFFRDRRTEAYEALHERFLNS